MQLQLIDLSYVNICVPSSVLAWINTQVLFTLKVLKVHYLAQQQLDGYNQDNAGMASGQIQVFEA